MLAYNLILFGTVFLILYAYRTVHIVSKEWSSRNKWFFRVSFLVLALFIYVTTSYLAENREAYTGNEFIRSYTIIGAITLSVTLLSISIFQLLADLVLLGRYLFFRFSASNAAGKKMKRRTFMNTLALGVGGIIMGSFIWGTTKGKYGWRILTNQLSFDNLPKAFDGLKIVQISDLHLGSFNDNFEPIKEAVQMINDLEPDYIFFTGDLVNESPTEAEPWIAVLKALKAKHDKYSILGNHDYGWGKISEAEKIANSKGVVEITKRMGFKVLLNEHQIIERQGEKIGLVGVENWGFSEQNWFPTKGDYKKSVAGMEEVPFKILLSHDPSHWDHHIVGKEQVDLTLSGHTHGGQVGITIPGLLEISAAKLFYKRYAGLYKEGKQHLYINRGLGFLIFPGRVGIPPEITLHVLSTA
ncbi:MAG: putative MPP superfamily phosphohydrolase [Saprospiraceae bacterium]|jgi:predicted MPP superfamily phosphohydrolase